MALRNVTLTADGDLIDRVRAKCVAKHTTLNEKFREWLQTEVATEEPKWDIEEFVKKHGFHSDGYKWNRDEANERG